MHPTGPTQGGGAPWPPQKVPQKGSQGGPPGKNPPSSPPSKASSSTLFVPSLRPNVVYNGPPRFNYKKHWGYLGKGSRSRSKPCRRYLQQIGSEAQEEGGPPGPDEDLGALVEAQEAPDGCPQGAPLLHAQEEEGAPDRVLQIVANRNFPEEARLGPLATPQRGPQLFANRGPMIVPNWGYRENFTVGGPMGSEMGPQTAAASNEGGPPTSSLSTLPLWSSFGAPAQGTGGPPIAPGLLRGPRRRSWEMALRARRGNGADGEGGPPSVANVQAVAANVTRSVMMLPVAVGDLVTRAFLGESGIVSQVG